MTNAHGVDISSYQGSPDLDMMAAKASFVIMRHSIGALNDKQFQRNWAGLEGKTLRGMYYVPHPNTSGTTAKAKLREMMEYKADFPIVLDIEISGVYIDAVYGLAGYIYQKTGKYPMIYTSPGFWGSLWGYANKTHEDFFKKCPLWVANYKVSKPGLVQPWGNNWTIWQYGINANKDDVEAYGLRYWESKAIDENWFNGDLMDLYKFCGVGDIEPEPEEPPDPNAPKQVRTITHLRGRTQPVYIPGQSALIYDPNTVLDVIDEPEVYEAASGITWLPVRMWVSKAYTTEV